MRWVFAVTLVGAGLGPAVAANADGGTTVTINGGSSCTTAGGSWASSETCVLPSNYTVLPGDTLVIGTVARMMDELDNQGQVDVLHVGALTGAITNSGVLSLSGLMFPTGELHNTTEGRVEVNAGGGLRIFSPSTLLNDGHVTVHSGGSVSNQSSITNNGTITVECGGTYSQTGSLIGNEVVIPTDCTAPVVTVTGVEDGAVYYTGLVPAAGCVTTDAGSGVATSATLTLTGGNADGTGQISATCSGASDNAGNTGSASVTYTVISPQDGIALTEDKITALVDDGTLKANQSRGLSSPLDNATRSLDDGKTASACSQVGDFISKVMGMTPSPLDAATAAELIADADQLRTGIGC